MLRTRLKIYPVVIFIAPNTTVFLFSFSLFKFLRFAAVCLTFYRALRKKISGWLVFRRSGEKHGKGNSFKEQTRLLINIINIKIGGLTNYDADLNNFQDRRREKKFRAVNLSAQ